MHPSQPITFQPKSVILANPRGFCAGVDRAIAIVDRALEKFGAPIYVRHEVVHNKHVVDDLKSRGAIFVEELKDVPDLPDGAVVIYSAHGVSLALQAEAAGRKFRVFDATCPLVTKVHVEVAQLRKQDVEIIMIGHQGHPEVEGTMGQAKEGIFLVEDEADVLAIAASGKIRNPEKVAFVTQTTLSVDDTAKVVESLQRAFPEIRPPRKDDICYATTNRQNAVKEIAPMVDVFIVVGSKASSNANRLREVAERLGAQAYLVDDADALAPDWFTAGATVGVTAGASTPEHLVMGVIDRLAAWGFAAVREAGDDHENVSFRLPSGL
ncbi:MAG: 4-hydroxy-3-methylbut-2-enyl diphosphate reductase [Rhizobacter sp.]|nr:4-hydroxy-3-methylbut-2-enyl diphosphate reductase [Burkholderiales bacterium]